MTQEERIQHAREFYEANATTICNVPRVGHPEDPSGWAGVRRASEARFIADDALVMTIQDAYDYAAAYAQSREAQIREEAYRTLVSAMKKVYPEAVKAMRDKIAGQNAAYEEFVAFLRKPHNPPEE